VNRELERMAERELVLTHLEHWEFPRTLVFYGPEGIGKTTLLETLRSDIIAKRPKAVVVTADCEAEVPKNSIELLLFFRIQISVQALRQNCRPQFLAFDLAMLEYKRQKSGKYAAEELEKELASLSDSNLRKLLSQAGPVFGAVPVPGVGELVGALAEWGLPRLMRLAREQEAQTMYKSRPSALVLRDVKDMLPSELEKHLPALLAEDIRTFLTANGAYRLVFLLDNFDGLWGGEANQHRPRRVQPDGPLQQLRAALTDALFVISDRTDLVWHAPNDVALPFITEACCHELTCLSDGAQREYLSQHGMDDLALQDAVTEVAEGHPIWLRFLLERYDILRKNGLTVDPRQLRLSTDQVESIVEQDLDPWEREAVRRLSVCVWFDEALYSSLLCPDGGIVPIRFHEFCRRSFVQPAGDAAFSIHSVFRIPVLNALTAQAPQLLNRFRDEAMRHLVSRRNLVGHTQAITEAYDSVWRLARAASRGPDAAAALDQFLSTDAFKIAVDAGKSLEASLHDMSVKLDEMIEDNKRASGELKRAFSSPTQDYHRDTLDLVWRQMRPDIMTRFAQLSVRGRLNSTELSASLSARILSDTYHSLRLDGVDVTIDVVRAALVESISLAPRNVHVNLGVHMMVQNEIESDRTDGHTPYSSLRGDLQRWRSKLVPPGIKVHHGSSTPWNRATLLEMVDLDYVPPSPDNVEPTMVRFESMLRDESHPGARAILGLLGLVFIQPFDADNELLGRLLMNRILVAGGYEWVIIPSQLKNSYFSALAHACGVGSDELGVMICDLLESQSKISPTVISENPTAAYWPCGSSS
jgi:hypothetical protein